jgi:hypothetical protein
MGGWVSEGMGGYIGIWKMEFFDLDSGFWIPIAGFRSYGSFYLWCFGFTCSSGRASPNCPSAAE